MTTVTEKNSFTTKLAYDVNETGNPLTSCDKRRTVFCPGKWRIFRTKRTIGADSSGKTGIFPDDNGKSERICKAESWQIWTANFMPLLSTKTPVFVDRQYKNQLLSMKSWVLVDRMQNNRNFTLSHKKGGVDTYSNFTLSPYSRSGRPCYKKETPYNRLIIRSLSGCPVGFEPTTFRTTI